MPEVSPKSQGKAPQNSPWWQPARHADRRPALLARGRIQAAIRAWFGQEGFWEVDPPALQVSPGNEAYLHAFKTTLMDEAGQSYDMYLHTSPEFAMKKLLAAGETQIFAFAHVFRNREGGGRHAAEFTMLEWYRVGAPYTQLMDDCQRLLAIAAQAAGTTVFSYKGVDCDPYAPLERISVAQAFQRYAGIDLLATCEGAQTDAAALRAQARARGLKVADDDTWADMLSKILVEKVEPHLGHGRATVLDRYPAAEAALARPAADDARVAERFEVYVAGVELANGFGELTNAVEQRRRFELEMDEKERVFGERYPLDEDFLAALGSMPPASGIALGFDRLVMLATCAPRLEDVIWAPVTLP